MGSVSTHRGTSSMSATLHHHVCCCSVQSHAASGAGASAADATASASAAPLCLWGTHKIASGPCRSCKRPRQETSRERQRGQRSSPLLTPCSSTSRPPRRGRSAAGSAACIAALAGPGTLQRTTLKKSPWTGTSTSSADGRGGCACAARAGGGAFEAKGALPADDTRRPTTRGGKEMADTGIGAKDYVHPVFPS